MKIVFFGSDKFAVPSLDALLEAGYQVVAVVTQPDRKGGRHLKFKPTAIKLSAQYKGLPVFQPDDVNSPEALNYLSNLKADIFVVASFGQMLKKRLLELARLFAINIHASLLPRYRGAAPINWAIINGETKTGITVIRMNEKMDAGDIILQEEMQINRNDTAISLEDRLSQLGGALVLKSLRLIQEGAVSFKRQDDAIASWAPRLKKSDGLIDWNWTAFEIFNRVRGLLPWPGAFTFLNGKRLRLLRSEVLEQQAASPGEILKADKEAIVVSTGKFCLAIKELQLESRRKMTVSEFIAGHKLKAGDMLGK
jgi:methionyl-tRNA formyltransferase